MPKLYKAKIKVGKSTFNKTLLINNSNSNSNSNGSEWVTGWVALSATPVDNEDVRTVYISGEYIDGDVLIDGLIEVDDDGNIPLIGYKTHFAAIACPNGDAIWGVNNMNVIHIIGWGIINSVSDTAFRCDSTLKSWVSASNKPSIDCYDVMLDEANLDLIDEKEEIGSFGLGWAFYKSNGSKTSYPNKDTNSIEWIKGFCAAMADYEEFDGHTSISTALKHYAIDDNTLEEQLKAAEEALQGDEWMRWPSVPVREAGK